MTCNECHDEGDVEVDAVAGKVDAIHAQCIGCHEGIEAGPVECSSCHVL